MTYEFIYEFMYIKNIVKSYLKSESCVPRFQVTGAATRMPESHGGFGVTLASDSEQYRVRGRRGGPGPGPELAIRNHCWPDGGSRCQLPTDIMEKV